MLRPNPYGDVPQVDDSCYVDPTALLIGKVIVEAGVFIGPYAVIRADEVDENGTMQTIVIGARSNIQDGVVIHSKAGAAVRIGADSSIAHRAIIHGPCTIGTHAFIGFNSVAFACTIGDHCVIRHNAVVEQCQVPNGFHIPSCTVIRCPADLDLIERVDADLRDFSESVLAANRSLTCGYKALQDRIAEQG